MTPSVCVGVSCHSEYIFSPFRVFHQFSFTPNETRELFQVSYHFVNVSCAIYHARHNATKHSSWSFDEQTCAFSLGLLFVLRWHIASLHSNLWSSRFVSVLDSKELHILSVIRKENFSTWPVIVPTLFAENLRNKLRTSIWVLLSHFTPWYWNPWLLRDADRCQFFCILSTER